MNTKDQKLQMVLETTDHQLIQPKKEWPHTIRSSLEYINNHRFDRRLTVGWLKEQCNIAGSNFSGKFKYYVGKSPQTYWLELRIAVAKKLLQEEALVENGLIGIALALGFNTHSAFTTTFKNYVGCPPSEFCNDYI